MGSSNDPPPCPLAPPKRLTGYVGGELDPDANPISILHVPGPERFSRHHRRRIRGRGTSQENARARGGGAGVPDRTLRR